MKKLDVNTWKCQLEVRPFGAIGSFSWLTFQVRAEADKVVEWAVEDAHMLELETRGVRQVKRLA